MLLPMLMLLPMFMLLPMLMLFPMLMLLPMPCPVFALPCPSVSDRHKVVL
jgi:hypothetical protein